MQRWRSALIVLTMVAPGFAAPAGAAEETGSTPRGAMALLIRNPDTADGQPPFALADQYGRIQRLVEPTPGVPLDRHVGERVRIKHDTGRTLLASQLELPGVDLRNDSVGLRSVSPAQFVSPQRTAQGRGRADRSGEGRQYSVVPAQLNDEIDRGIGDLSDDGEAIDLDRVLADEKRALADEGRSESLPAPSRSGRLEPIPSEQYYPEVVSGEPMMQGGHDPDCPHCRQKMAASQRAVHSYQDAGVACPHCNLRPATRCQSCGNTDGWCGPTCNPASRRGLYGRIDYLLWWVKGMDTPPLVTTNDLGNAPILGDPGTRVVYGGGDDLLNGPRNGLRLTVGAWLDDRRDVAIEGDWLILETESDAFSINNPNGGPTYGRPFYNIAPVDINDNLLGPAEDVQLVNFNNQVGGALSIYSRSQFQSYGVRLRTGICCRDIGGCQPCGCDSCSGAIGVLGGGGGGRSGISRIDFIGGYRYAGLKEQIGFHESVTQLSTQAGVTVNERFETSNDFNGVDLGFVYDWQSSRWGLELTSKIAVGGTHQNVRISGSNTAGLGTATVTTPGGLLAQTSNIGNYERDRFSVLPELAARLSYKVTPQLSLSAGYSLLYWANVVRPGDAIDYSVDGRLASGALTTATANSHPRFDWNETSFWAHGLDVGLNYNY